MDYTQKFIALFNVEHEPLEALEIHLEPGKPPVPDMPDLKILMTEMDTVIRCDGRDAFVLRQISVGEEVSDLGIAMIPGTSVMLAAAGEPNGAEGVNGRGRLICWLPPDAGREVRYGCAAGAGGGAEELARDVTGAGVGGACVAEFSGKPAGIV